MSGVWGCVWCVYVVCACGVCVVWVHGCVWCGVCMCACMVVCVYIVCVSAYVVAYVRSGLSV